MTKQEREIRVIESQRELRAFVNERLASMDDPSSPVYFVDSPLWQTDSQTAGDLAAMHGFICRIVVPLRTRNRLLSYSPMWQIEKATRNDVPIREKIEGDKRIRTWADQEREKRISHDGGDMFDTEWRTIQTRETVEADITYVASKIATVDQLREDMVALKDWMKRRSLFDEFRRKCFNLLWRVSRDGFTAKQFHRRCDGRPNTLTTAGRRGAKTTAGKETTACGVFSSR
jgi:hypothetical protein